MARSIEIFMPPNVLKAKLGSNGGGLDYAAIKRAEEAVETIKVQFPDWIAEDIELLSYACKAYLDGNHQALGRLYRAGHDLKGQAATFEYPLIARIAASLCRLLDAPDISPRILRRLTEAHVEAIKVAFKNQIKTESNVTALQLAEELEAQVCLAVERAAAAAQ